jgi:DNA primase
MIPEATQSFTPERQRYAVRKGIEKIKQEVSIHDYLRAHGAEVRGNRARCIIHGGDNNQAFSIDPERGLWHCFRCNEGGDIITLCELVERHLEPWTAMVSLAEQFGVVLPRRGGRWHKWQDEKTKIRDVAAEARKAVRRERLFKLLVLSGPEFDIANAQERREAVAHAWDIFSTGMKRIGQ